MNAIVSASVADVYGRIEIGLYYVPRITSKAGWGVPRIAAPVT